MIRNMLRKSASLKLALTVRFCFLLPLVFLEIAGRMVMGHPEKYPSEVSATCDREQTKGFEDATGQRRIPFWIGWTIGSMFSALALAIGTC